MLVLDWTWGLEDSEELKILVPKVAMQLPEQRGVERIRRGRCFCSRHFCMTSLRNIILVGTLGLIFMHE